MAGVDLTTLAQSLLDSAAAALASTSSGPVARTLLAHGPPVFDCCDLCAVHVQSLGEHELARPGAPNMQQVDPAIPLVTFVLTFGRCYPIVGGGITITPPTAAAMTAGTAALQEDLWTVYNYLKSRARASTLFPSRPCRSVKFTPAIPVGPDGGCAGWTLTVAVSLDGYAA
jgi:hypothetical protein